jgi:hypothetical protein
MLVLIYLVFIVDFIESHKESWVGWSKNVWLVIVTAVVNQSYIPSLL